MKSKIKKDSIWILIIGLALALPSVIAAFYKINFWYFPAVIGFWFIFDYFASSNNKTTLQILLTNKKDFLKLYFLIFLLGCAIELFGRFIFKLWIYPTYTNSLFDLVNLIFYPFILFSFRESFRLISSLLKNKIISTILAMFIGIIIWEIPNIYSRDWIYTIPFIKFEVFHINIIVIIGWVLLIIPPLIVYKMSGVEK